MRRLFSQQIIDSDAFIDLPPGAQLLYFHLAMRADDDGFLGSPKKILRMIFGQKKDLDILISKRFLLSFNSGVVVVKHWLIHNSIRKDRYNETKYLEEKGLIEIKENGSYTERQPSGNRSATVRQPFGNRSATQIKLNQIKLKTVESSDSTPAIKLGKEIYTMEELEYVPEDQPEKKSLYGRKTMAVIVRHFAKCAGVEIAGTYDATPWLKSLSAIYKNFDKDAQKTMDFISRASKYFEGKKLSFTPATLHKDLPFIEKWIMEKKDKDNDLDISRRRIL